MSEYLKIMSRKRSWTPVAVDKGPVTEGAEDTLKRCLALRTLSSRKRDVATGSRA